MTGRFVPSVDRTGEFCWEWEECRHVSMPDMSPDVLDGGEIGKARLQAEGAETTEAEGEKAPEAKDGPAAEGGPQSGQAQEG